MLRENNVACGIATTGTGTLTLAASPASLGALDPFQAFGAMGLGTALPCFMPYSLVEFTDATFATILQREMGNGLLLLGADIGHTSLARTVVRQTQIVATGANTRGSAQNVIAPITVGTAANCLVFIGPDVDDALPALPGVNTSSSSTPGAGGIQAQDGLGYVGQSGQPGTPNTIYSGQTFYSLLRAESTDLIKTASFYCGTAITAPTTFSLAAALYSLQPSTFLPDRKLIDFGATTTNPSPSSPISLTATAGGIIGPGFYALAVQAIFTGGSGNLTLFTLSAFPGSSPWGTKAGNGVAVLKQLSQTTLPDPASQSAYFAATYPQPLFVALRNF